MTADRSRLHGLTARLRRSRLVYLWAIASVAWLIHAALHLLAHGGVLFAMAPADAAALLARTLVDVVRPIALGALLLVPPLAIGVLRRTRP